MVAAIRIPLWAIFGWLAAFWYQWMSRLGFSGAGSESHWVMSHIGSLRFIDGLSVGALYAVAGLGLAAVLKVRRAWAAVVVGAVLPGLVMAAMGRLDGSVSEMLLRLELAALPLLAVGFVTVLSPVRFGSLGIAVVAWWPAFFHLLGYLRADGLPEGFRLGIGVMWLGGGLLAWEVARYRGPGVER